MNTPSLKKNAVLNIFKTLLSLIFPLITFPYVARILLPEGIGKVNFAKAIIEYFVLISTLGIQIYAVREGAKVREDKYQLSKFSREIFTINVVSTIVAYLLFFIALVYVPKFSEYRALLCIISATILFTTLGMEWLYSAVEDYEYITKRYIVFNILSIILLFALVKKQEDYLIYASISVISNVGANICNFVHSRKYIDFYAVKKLELHRHIKPIFIVFAMAATIKVYTVLDTTMLGFLCDDWQVGIYSAAVKLNKIVIALVVAAATVVMPRLSLYSEKQEKAKFDNLVRKGLDILMLAALPCTIGLSLLSHNVVFILSGAAYEAAIPVMKLMNPIIILIGLSNFIGLQLFMPLRKENYTLYSVIAGAVVNFALNLVLIPMYQALGAAIATLCAESVVTGVQLSLAYRIVDMRKLFKTFLLYLFNSLVMAVFVFLCLKFVPGLWLGTCVAICTGVLVYGILLAVEKNHFVMDAIKFIRNKLSC